MNAVQKFRNYVYEVRFLVETDANTVVHWLNFPGNDLPGALVTCCITGIQLFDFDVKHVPGRLNGCPVGLSRRPRVKGELEPKQEYDLGETIEACLQGMRVERVPERKSRGSASAQFVGLRQAEEYNGR
jgi:hypothetical protein